MIVRELAGGGYMAFFVFGCLGSGETSWNTRNAGAEPDLDGFYLGKI